VAVFGGKTGGVFFSGLRAEFCEEVSGKDSTEDFLGRGGGARLGTFSLMVEREDETFFKKNMIWIYIYTR
jgi:hypothetical protein